MNLKLKACQELVKLGPQHKNLLKDNMSHIVSPLKSCPKIAGKTCVCVSPHPLQAASACLQHATGVPPAPGVLLPRVSSPATDPNLSHSLYLGNSV